MSQDALGQLKHLKTARARWPFPDVAVPPVHHAFIPAVYTFLHSFCLSIR